MLAAFAGAVPLSTNLYSERGWEMTDWVERELEKIAGVELSDGCFIRLALCPYCNAGRKNCDIDDCSGVSYMGYRDNCLTSHSHCLQEVADILRGK